jgi:hypothetical protein
MRKLTPTKVRRIYLSTESARATAKRYGVTPGMVSHIWTGRRWGHVTKDLERPR